MNDRLFQTVVVTGGAGFIGSNFVSYAIKTHPQWKIRVLDKLTYAGNIENLSDVIDKVTFYHGDISVVQDVREALDGADAVINFAAESHVDRSLVDPTPFLRTNIDGTVILMSECLKANVGRYLQVSTDEVYGDLVGTDINSIETDPFNPRSPYAASKAAAEHLVNSFVHSYGLDACITRGSNTYGPYQYPEKIIPLFITNLLQNKKIPLYGDGSAVRDYMHVEDHAAGIDAILHKGTKGEVYNLGAREQISGNQLAHLILEIMGRPIDYIEYVKDRPGHDYRYSIDPSKAEDLGWNRTWNFKKGLLETIKWYTQNTKWWTDIKAKLAYIEHENSWYR